MTGQEIDSKRKPPVTKKCKESTKERVFRREGFTGRIERTILRAKNGKMEQILHFFEKFVGRFYLHHILLTTVRYHAPSTDAVPWMPPFISWKRSPGTTPRSF